MNPSLPRNLSFRADSFIVGKNNRVGRLKPSEDGIYKGLPMMTLGETTQQNTYYDPASVVDQITSPTSRFNMVLKQGKLGGEYGHPSFITGYNSDAERIQRLTTVDEKNISHVFTSFYTDAPSSDGTVIVRADLKPAGPYGAVFKESLDDPVMNTAFSLRAYVDTQVDRATGRKNRTVKSLVTFDTVFASGFRGSDKAHALGLESFSGDQFLDSEMTVMENGTLKIDQIALESISNTELNEIFGTADIHRIIQSTTIVTPDPSLHERFPNLYRKSIFEQYFKEI